MRLRGNSKKELFTCFGRYIYWDCITELRNLSMKVPGDYWIISFYRIACLEIRPNRVHILLVPSDTPLSNTRNHGYGSRYAWDTHKTYDSLLITNQKILINNYNNIFYFTNLFHCFYWYDRIHMTFILFFYWDDHDLKTRYFPIIFYLLFYSCITHSVCVYIYPFILMYVKSF